MIIITLLITLTTMLIKKKLRQKFLQLQFDWLWVIFPKTWLNASGQKIEFQMIQSLISKLLQNLAED
jgi:peptidyl-tRNA hydrolase